MKKAQDLFSIGSSGEIVFVNVDGSLPPSDFYVPPPFKIEYSVYDGKREYHGASEHFSVEKITDGGAIEYKSKDGLVLVRVEQKKYDGLYTQKCTVTNLGSAKLTVKQLYNYFGFVDLRLRGGNYLTESEIGVIHSDWGGEGQLFWHEPHELGVIRPTRHNTVYTCDLTSSTCWTTKKYVPVVFVRDKVTGAVFFMQHLPDGPYCIELGLSDIDSIDGSCFTLAAGAGTSERHGFRVYLNKGESYTSCESAMGGAKSFDEAVGHLTNWRRKELLNNKRAPLMFNDYMNCLWTRQSYDACVPLIDKAAEVGVEGFCFDDGWWRQADTSGYLGDWEPNDERFGPHTFQDLIDYVKSKGLVAGLWTELEASSIGSKAESLPDECFLTNEGNRIYRSGRHYFNLGNKQAKEYLMAKLSAIYDMGIRYIKNDYNGHPGAGVDYPNMSPLAGLEQHARASNEFYREISERFPDLYIENCGSGAMRSDGQINRNFSVQSVSDCEEYYKLPSIVSGTFLSLVPEQVGIWAYPYPRIFWDMNGDEYLTDEYRKSQADGAQTVFNMACGSMGVLYLSGKIDKADEYNTELIKAGVRLYKELRPFIEKATPFYPLPLRHIYDKEYNAIGLKSGKTAVVSVFRVNAESSEVLLPIDGAVKAEEIYPCKSCGISLTDGGVKVSFTKPYQAVTIKITLE